MSIYITDPLFSLSVGGTILGGTDKRVLFDDNGTLGEDAGFYYDKNALTLFVDEISNAVSGNTFLLQGLDNSPLTINAGNATGSNNGPSAIFSGGQGGPSGGRGGNLQFNAGTPNVGNGGSLTFNATSAAGAGSHTGGSINFQVGSGINGGASGTYNFTAPGGIGTVKFDLSAVGSTRTVLFKDLSGTIVLSDIASGTGTNTSVVTSGNGFSISSSLMQSGNVVRFVSNSPDANGNTQTVLNVATSGANNNSTQTTYGGQFSNTHTGTSSTNVAFYATASGGTNNYAGIFNAGFVGIGTTAPGSQLQVTSSATSTINLILKNISSQTANVLECHPSGSTTPYLFIGPATLVSNNGDSNFFQINGALPVSTNAVGSATFTNTPSNSGVGQYTCHKAFLDINTAGTYTGGYTGFGYTIGEYVANYARGTGNAALSGGQANYGTYCQSLGTTTGQNVGFYGDSGNASLNVGVVAVAIRDKNSATNIGMEGAAYNGGSSSHHIGGYFVLRSNPSAPSVNAGLIADNGAQTDPIFRAQDNAVDVFVINDGGTITFGGDSTKWAGNSSSNNYTSLLTSGVDSAINTTGILYLNVDSDNSGTDGAWSFGHNSTNSSATEVLRIEEPGYISKYNGVTTTGWGIPAIYKSDRSVAATGAVSLAAYTVGSADGSFIVSANVLITASTLFNFSVTCTYTDEGNTSRTLTIPFTNLAGTALTGITNAAGAVPYEGIPQHIRCKASTTITVASTGTFTTVTYNIEEMITQIA